MNKICTNKNFQLARVLSLKYQDFRIVMSFEPPYFKFNLFIISLQIHEQTLIIETK